MLAKQQNKNLAFVASHTCTYYHYSTVQHWSIINF